MKKFFTPKILLIFSLFIIVGIATAYQWNSSLKINSLQATSEQQSFPGAKTVLLAGGCFWSVEHDLENITGIISITTGYAGGTAENPTYDNYVAGGHREVVEVTYDPNRITYENLVESLTKHSDPTDASGSFFDRGPEYAPAVYYETEEEKNEAEDVLARINSMNIYPQPIVTLVLLRPTFWPAEEHHQDYAKKHPIAYGAYRTASGRTEFTKKYWGNNAETFFTNTP